MGAMFPQKLRQDEYCSLRVVIARYEQEDDESDSKDKSDGLQSGGGGRKIKKVSLPYTCP